LPAVIPAENGNTLKPLDWPPIHVDVRVPRAQLEAMIKRVEDNFRHLGEVEPHWSVLTADRFRADSIAASEAEFFQSGKEPVQMLTATLARSGLVASRFETCFELGCGVGRSTIWLAEQFRWVIAADISSPHLKLAEEAARKWQRANINFLLADRIGAIDNAPRFDLFFSVIVLQHNPPPIIHALLGSAFDRLNPGGVAYFQVPTYRLGYKFDAAAYLASPFHPGTPEMHVLPQPELHRLMAERGCRVVEMREDGAAGGHNISSRILAQKL
jgi:SAM-dependent methyltransferase